MEHLWSRFGLWASFGNIFFKTLLLRIYSWKYFYFISFVWGFTAEHLWARFGNIGKLVNPNHPGWWRWQTHWKWIYGPPETRYRSSWPSFFFFLFINASSSALKKWWFLLSFFYSITPFVHHSLLCPLKEFFIDWFLIELAALSYLESSGNQINVYFYGLLGANF